MPLLPCRGDIPELTPFSRGGMETIMAKSIKQFVHQAGALKRIPVSGTFELTPR